MNSISQLKGAGYLVSTISVILLGIVAWDGTKGEIVLRTCLTLGMITAIAGMALRWTSHRRDQRKDGEA